MPVKKTPRTPTLDEVALIGEIINYCGRFDMSPNKWNVEKLIRKHYPGRGKKLSREDIYAYVDSVTLEPGS